MAKKLTTEEAVERAKRAQENRLNAIRDLAEAHHNVTTTREQTTQQLAQIERETTRKIADAERNHTQHYNAALTSGWTTTELRKIGFNNPEKTHTQKPAEKKTTNPNTDKTPPTNKHPK